MMERYIVALKMRLDGLTYKAIGEAFGLSGTMGHYLVWRGGRALNFPENSSHPEKELLNHPDIQKIRGVEQWTSKSP